MTKIRKDKPKKDKPKKDKPKKDKPKKDKLKNYKINNYNKVSILMLVFSLLAVDMYPFISYGVDGLKTEEVGHTEKIENDQTEDSGKNEGENVADTLEDEQEESNLPEPEIDYIDEQEEVRLTEPEINNLNNLNSLNTISGVGGKDVQLNQQTSRVSLAMLTPETTNNYVMAKDSDFSGTTNGNFRYIGNDDYVEIPHTIKGVRVSNYYMMFRESNVKGVKSTNKNITNMGYMFYELRSTTLDVSQLDTSSVGNMEFMFSTHTTDSLRKGRLTTITGLDNFNTSKVSNMSAMFLQSLVTELDLTSFDTRNVQTMRRMFENSRATVIKGLETFDTRNLRSMHEMFRQSQARSLPLGNFDTSKVTDMNSVFFLSRARHIDVSSFDTSNVTTMVQMFWHTVAEEIDVSNFDTSRVTSMSYMFASSRFNELDLSNFDTSNVRSMVAMFSSSLATRIDVSSFDTSRVTTMNSMFRATRATELDIGHFNTQNVTDMANMFVNSRATRINVKGLDTRNATEMVSMFSGTQAEELDLSTFDTSKVTSMRDMFKDSQATKVNVSNLNTSNVTSMHSMFSNSQAESLDLRSFDTSRVTDMENMFHRANAQELDLSSFDTYRLTSMKNMFNGAKARIIDVSNFDTRYVTDMSYMFSHTVARELDLRSFDMGSVNSTVDMFTGSHTQVGRARASSDAQKLNAVVGKPSRLVFDSTYVLAKDSDFIGTINGSLRYIGTDDYVELPNVIRGINVTSYRDMFANTSVLGVISANPNVVDMSGMFKGNTSEQLDVSSLNTTSVVNMSGMFQDTKMGSVNLTNFSTSGVTNMSNMFRNAQVRELDLGSFDLTKVTHTDNMFTGVNAQVGYARRAEDLDKLNRSVGKPEQLRFSIWSITTEQESVEWTNKETDIRVNAVSDAYGVRFVERVNEEGRNLVLRSNVPVVSTAYNVANYNLSEDWAVGETWTITIKGTVNEGNAFGVWSNGSMTRQARIEPIGNDLHTATFTVVQPPSSGNKTFHVYNVPSGTARRATIEWVKMEKGSKRTDWSPAPEDSGTSGDRENVYTVYNNGTYIFRATYGNGETRTVSHTVSNIDRTLPKATVEPSITGQTSQDVTLFVNATDYLSGVKSITFPDGTVVNGDKAEFIATENKKYDFKVTDNAGNTSEVSYTVNNIDRSLVVVKTEVDKTSWTNNPINIKVTSEESASRLVGIDLVNSPIKGRNLVLDSGRRIRTTTEYLIGGYTMSQSWKKGEEYVATITGEVNEGQMMGIWFNGASNFQGSARRIADRKHQLQFKGITFTDVNGVVYGDDHANNMLFRVYNRGSTGGVGARFGEIDNVKLEIGNKPTPYTPAPEDIKIINNSKTYPVVANGVYTYKARYENGVTSEVSVNVTNIDLDAPTMTVLNNPEDWVEDDEIELEIIVDDNNQSGVKSITLPNKQVVTGESARYRVTENGDYHFTLEDNIGNKETVIITVDKLMTPYFFYMFDNNNRPLQGAEFTLLRDGVEHATAVSDVNGLVDFGKVPPVGNYTIKQTKAPDGHVVSPDEKGVEIGDNTDPEPFISYPRGVLLPSTGTTQVLLIVLVIKVLVGLIWVTGKYKKAK